MSGAFNAESDQFRPEIEVSLDFYPPSDVDASQRPHRGERLYLAYLKTPFTPTELHMVATLIPFFDNAEETGTKAEFWARVPLFFFHVFQKYPADQFLEALEFRVVHGLSTFLFEGSLDIPSNGVLRSTRHFWTLCDAHRDDAHWYGYAKWNTAVRLEFALYDIFGSEWRGLGALPDKTNDLRLIEWGYRVRGHIYELRMVTMAMDYWFQSWDPVPELVD
ncbi:hypothetical protein BDZ89DRAFT_1138464 [Hymenopellis radicata]|nr:hypothetical protein BDZ89DRAFT_1138464 [Hymenopellis radicata]